MQMKQLVILLVFVCHVSTSSPPPNIMLIIVDDLRPSLGAYGDLQAVTPHIDALAARSSVFDLAFAQQALCGPSRNSFLTSRRPDTTRLYDFYSYWREVAGNFTTLPQHFTEHGYQTHSIGKVFHPGISSNFSDDSRYSWSEKPFHPSSEAYMNKAVCPSGADGQRHRNLLCPVDVHLQPESTLPDLQSAQEAVDFLQSRRQKMPFFLAVGFHKPHVPFRIPREYLSLHPLHKVQPPENSRRPRRMPDIAWNPWQSIRTREDMAQLNMSFPYGPMPELYSRLIRQHYYAAVSYVDRQVGVVLRALEEEGLEGETIISLVGDHGWSLGEHGEWAKFSNFEVSVRVPWILHVPTSREKGIISAPVELLDLFPTLVDLAGLPQVPSCPPGDSSKVRLCTQGKSRAKLNASSGDFAFSQYPRPSMHPTTDSDQPRLEHIAFMGYSVRSKRYRFTEWVAFDHSTMKPDWSNIVAMELYDHEVDPQEDHNKARSQLYSGVLKELKRKLRQNFSPAVMSNKA